MDTQTQFEKEMGWFPATEDEIRGSRYQREFRDWLKERNQELINLLTQTLSDTLDFGEVTLETEEKIKTLLTKNGVDLSEV